MRRSNSKFVEWTQRAGTDALIRTPASVDRAADLPQTLTMALTITLRCRRSVSDSSRVHARSNHNSNAISFHRVKGFRRHANVRVRLVAQLGFWLKLLPAFIPSGGNAVHGGVIIDVVTHVLALNGTG